MAKTKLPPWLKIVRTPMAQESVSKAIPLDSEERVTGPLAALALLKPLAMAEEVENAWVVLLDLHYQVRGVVEVARGHIDSVPSHPREVFRVAVAYGAASIVFAHNHIVPDAQPSPPDLGVAKRLMDAGVVLGIPVLASFVIAADGSYTSIDEDTLPRLLRESIDQWGAWRYIQSGLADLIPLAAEKDKKGKDEKDDNEPFMQLLEGLLKGVGRKKGKRGKAPLLPVYPTAPTKEQGEKDDALLKQLEDAHYWQVSTTAAVVASTADTEHFYTALASIVYTGLLAGIIVLVAALALASYDKHSDVRDEYDR